MRLFHISDLHFGKPYLPAIGEAVLRAAEAARPDVIVVSGDLTQRAKVGQFAEARAFLERLPDVPRVVVPGNHDVPLYRVAERVVSPYRNYQQYISGKLDHVEWFPGAVIVGLNSSCPYRAITGGRLRPHQFEFAARAFASAKAGQARIVVVHHPLAVSTNSKAWEKPLRRARHAMDRFAALKVDLVLCGHFHLACVVNPVSVPQANGDHHPLVLQCGTTTSRRHRDQTKCNSLNIVQLTESQIEIETHRHKGGDFQPIERHIATRIR